jgi:hypothetical protein
MLATHGLFLSYTKNSIFIFTQHIINYSGRNPLSLALEGERKTKPHLLGRPMSCSWWRIPIHSSPLLGINCPPYFPISPHPLRPLSPYYITIMTSTILVFLIRNRREKTFGALPGSLFFYY